MTSAELDICSVFVRVTPLNVRFHLVERVALLSPVPLGSPLRALALH